MIFILFLVPFAFIGFFLAWFLLGLFQGGGLKPVKIRVPLIKVPLKVRETKESRPSFWLDFGKIF